MNVFTFSNETILAINLSAFLQNRLPTVVNMLMALVNIPHRLLPMIKEFG